ncbi:MAG: hypothetical protein IPH79_11745 [Sphingomonadales bacterium]|nr:hypothetical protein [Sphingomonadales bacterium]
MRCEDNGRVTTLGDIDRWAIILKADDAAQIDIGRIGIAVKVGCGDAQGQCTCSQR